MSQEQVEWRRGRRHAREAALQMLYQCELGGLAPDEAEAAFRQIDGLGPMLGAEARRFASTLLHGTVAGLAQIDPLIEASAEHWRLTRMAVVDRLVLRLAVFQLLHLPDVPPAVVIDESVELAALFGGPESSRFVNGVLDAIRRRLEAGPRDEAP
ncbi:MAG TPA: transcription antitermination factor NusB [Vicinamibacterales bacterium]|nr:transcription antitermination factor NusB [Vicinamibacterales bacterium]